MITLLDNLTADENGEIFITQKNLDELWEQIAGEDKSIAALNGKHIFLEEFKKATSSEIAGSDLHFKTMGWKIAVKKHLIKGVILTPVLYGILSYLGITTGLAAIVIPTIAPMLFDIENVELSKKEETIWLKLPLKKFRNQFKSAEEWYASLDADIQKQINFLDFQDFMEKLVSGGMAKTNKNEKYQLFKKGDNVFKLSFQ